MIIVWRGLGYLVLLAGMTGFASTLLVLGRVTSNENFFYMHGWPKLVAGVLAGLLAELLALGLNRWRNWQESRDMPEAERIDFTGVDTLFWIPVKYWAWIFLGFGIFASFT